MMAAAWPLSVVAGLHPASLSLTLLLATLLPPSPLHAKPCSSAPASSSPRRSHHLSMLCAGARPGAGRSGRLLRPHPQDQMHALVSLLLCSRLILIVSRDLLAVLTVVMFWISAASWRGPQMPSLRTPTRSRRFLVRRFFVLRGNTFR